MQPDLKPEKKYYLQTTNINKLFSHKDELSERDRIIRDALNQHSSFAQQYKYSDDEVRELARIKSEMHALQHRINELGKLGESIRERKNAIIFGNSQELIELLNAKINQNGISHQIKCDVNRKNGTINIMICDTDDERSVSKFIGNFTDDNLNIVSNNYYFAEEPERKVECVSFDMEFYQADELIKNLQSSHQTFNIPRRMYR